MALKKLCPKCNKVIDQGERYCSEHQASYKEYQKNRQKDYRNRRTDKKELNFYCSKEWEQLKDHLKIKYKGMCLYSYLVENKIVPVGDYHHIEPLKENWDKRLDVYNIISLSHQVHRKIHKLYETDKEATQKMLRDLLFKWKEIKING